MIRHRRRSVHAGATLLHSFTQANRRFVCCLFLDFGIEAKTNETPPLSVQSTVVCCFLGMCTGEHRRLIGVMAPHLAGPAA